MRLDNRLPSPGRRRVGSPRRHQPGRAREQRVPRALGWTRSHLCCSALEGSARAGPGTWGLPCWSPCPRSKRETDFPKACPNSDGLVLPEQALGTHGRSGRANRVPYRTLAPLDWQDCWRGGRIRKIPRQCLGFSGTGMSGEVPVADPERDESSQSVGGVSALPTSPAVGMPIRVCLRFNRHCLPNLSMRWRRLSRTPSMSTWDC